MRATYCPEDNKLRIYPEGTRVDSVLDAAEYRQFKAAGFKWAAKQERFKEIKMAADDYDWSTARVICNDAQKNTHEVQARRFGADGWWTVSDSAEMTEDEADAWLNNITCND